MQHCFQIPKKPPRYIQELSPSLTDGNKWGSPSASKSKLICKEIRKELEENGQEVTDNTIFETFVDRFYRNGYMHHGFNGSFEKAILEKGLSPNERFWNWDELSEIVQIGERIGIGPTIIGSGNINSKDRIFFEDNPTFTYGYAILSPEWFGRFVAGGSHIPSIPPYKKDAFYRRNYTAAKINIETFITANSTRNPKMYPNLTEAEANKIRVFFEKYWKLFAGEASLPKCALIKKAALGENVPITKSFQDYLANPDLKVFGPNIEGCIEYMLPPNAINSSIDTRVKPEDLTIISLPKYEEIHPLKT